MGQTCDTCVQKDIQFLPNQTIHNQLFNKQYRKIKTDLLLNSSNYQLKQYQIDSDTIFIGRINQQNQKEGYGELKSKQKLYAGNFYNNLPHGQGILIDKDYCYVGQFQNGKPHGNGNQKKNHIQFIGTYQNGQKLKGKLIHPDFTYEGYFKDNHFQGLGKIVYPQKQITYQGQFKNGKFHGQGLLSYKNKYKYEGQFKQGVYHGKGIMLSQCGQIFEGQFSHGTKNGQGRLQTTDGHQINTKWTNGNMHGRAIIKKQGQKYEAHCQQNKLLTSQHI